MASKKFRKKATIYLLKFEGDDDLDGLEVQMRSLPIEQFMEVTDMASAAAEDPKLGAKNTRLMFRVFASALVEWNLTDEFDRDVPPVLAQCAEAGNEVPEDGRCSAHRDNPNRCTVTGVMGQELDFILRIFGAWQEQMGGVSDPLRNASGSGRQSQEVSLPMEVSSPSPQS